MSDLLAQPLAQFKSDYREMLGELERTELSLWVCTIYTAIPFEDAVWRQFAPIAIGHFNDVIASEASSRNIPVLNLHDVCTEDSDFFGSVAD